MEQPSNGPWKLDAESDVIGCRNIVDASGNGIASTHGLYDDREDWANACVMATAWELLEALKQLVDWSDVGGFTQEKDIINCQKARDKANAIIDKATAPYPGDAIAPAPDSKLPE